MKHGPLLLLVFFLLSQSIGAQCVIDAGINRNVCPTEMDTARLYGEIISGEVVQVKWESSYYQPILDRTYYASVMLSDTTILQPVIEEHYDKTVMYKLTGLTADFQTCVDSVQINFSDWMFLTVAKVSFKAPKDTIELWSSAGSIWPHIKYEWSPNYMISDTSVEKPLVWNDTTVFYDLIITDSLGCRQADQEFKVIVSPSLLDEEIDEIPFVYPNPPTGYLQIDSEEDWRKYKLYDLDGRVLLEGSNPSVDLSTISDGTYILHVHLTNGKVWKTKILKAQN